VTSTEYKTKITVDLDTREWHALQRVFNALDKMKYRVLSIKKSSLKGYHIKAAHKIKKTFNQIISDRRKAFDDPLRIKYDIIRRAQGLPTQVLFRKKIRITKKLKEKILSSLPKGIDIKSRGEV